MKAFTALERTVADCGIDGTTCNTKPPQAISNDEAFTNKNRNLNSVEGRNLEFIRNFINITSPNCL